MAASQGITATNDFSRFDFSSILNGSFMDDQSFNEKSPEKSFIEGDEQLKKQRFNGTTPLKPPPVLIGLVYILLLKAYYFTNFFTFVAFTFLLQRHCWCSLRSNRNAGSRTFHYTSNIDRRSSTQRRDPQRCHRHHDII
jgi:hypothetical protein